MQPSIIIIIIIIIIVMMMMMMMMMMMIIIIMKMKMNVEMLSSQILGKRFPSSPTGVEPMTFQNTGWNALTTEL